MATKKRRREEKSHEEVKSQKKERLLEGGQVSTKNIFEPLKAMLDSYEARLKEKQDIDAESTLI